MTPVDVLIWALAISASLIALSIAISVAVIVVRQLVHPKPRVERRQ